MDTEARLTDALECRCGRREDGTLVLRCEDALALAEAFAVPAETVGRLCNGRGIKIIQCQLGCFA
jgi:hypothetical protein